MSGQKLNVLFLMIVCSLTGQITCSKTILIVQNLPAQCWNKEALKPNDIKLVCTPTCVNGLCTMNVALINSAIGGCNIDEYTFNITKLGEDHYEVRMNLTSQDITLEFLPEKVNCELKSKGQCPAKTECKYTDKCEGCDLLSVEPKKICKQALFNNTKCNESKNWNRYILSSNGTNWKCVTCENKHIAKVTYPKDIKDNKGSTNHSKASEFLETVESEMEELEKNNISKAAVDMGDFTGLIHILDENTETRDNCYLLDGDTIENGDCESDLNTDLPWSVKIPSVALNKSRLENHGCAFVGILPFTNMEEKNKTRNYTILNNDVFGISMRANISNLTKNIEMLFRQTNLEGSPSCTSWDGKGKLKWTTFGCDTEMIGSNTIKCSCSHLTFFAVLMSPITDSNTVPDLESLTLLSSIGCAISAFFLAIAVFMHFLLRKAKSNQATKILINMFVALFLLDVSFLSNESVANTENKAACVFIALLMHYSMLTTFTWFFIQALHMYLWLIRQNVTITNYVRKITVLGWVCSAPVVIVVVSLGGYSTVSLTASSGKIARMCWIKDPFIHYIVNTGYYIFVFIFTLGIFITIVSRIVQVRHTRAADGKRQTFRKQLMMVLSLFLLFGLTWAVAFFSYGPMLIPSYYIFSALNSFQGFFLFLYYYHIHKDVEGRFSDDPRSTGSTTTIVPPNIYAEENVYNVAN